VADWRQQQENEEERYYTEPVTLNWTQADIDRHRELLKELRELIKADKERIKCRNF
jgi:hypothetical protein